MHAASVYSSYDRGVIRGRISFAFLPRLGEHRRETHYCSLWNAGYDCPRSKFALVFAVFGNGRLPTLRLRHLSTMSCRSSSQERILHSKLHIPAIIAGHSAALARLLSPILLGFRSGNRAMFAAIRRASSRVSAWPQCPLYPQKRILLSATRMSALCQKRTSASVYSITSLACASTDGGTESPSASTSGALPLPPRYVPANPP